MFIWKQESSPHPPTLSPSLAWLSKRNVDTGVHGCRQKAGPYGDGLVPAGEEHLKTLIKVGGEDLFSIFGLDGVLQLWF